MLVSDKLKPTGRSAADPRTPVVPAVHVVDDEATVRTLFQNMARILPYEFRTHATAADFFSDFDESRPCCLVLDLHLPDRSGIEVLKDLANKRSNVPVVFMSGMASVGDAVKALKLGSLDFVEKPFDLQVMVDAIHRAVGKDLDRRNAAAATEALQKRFSRLTAREREVLELVVGGAANKDVASALGLSPKTVEVHRANVMRKTQAGSLAELVRLFLAAKGEGQPSEG
jgi:two-component system response regulator FixJ